MSDHQPADPHDQAEPGEADETSLPGADRDTPLPEHGATPRANELVEIGRLADALDRIDAGEPLHPHADIGLDDHELDHLLDVAGAIGRPLIEATEQRSFRSFHHRSRAAIVHLLEGDLASGAHRPVAHQHAQTRPVPVPTAVSTGAVPPRRRGVIAAMTRWTVIAPVATAAAVGALAVSAFAGGVFDSPADPPPPQVASTTTSTPDDPPENLTQRTTADELSRIAMALTDIRSHSDRGESVPAPLLREVAEGTARVANAIDLTPETVDKESVEHYSEAVRETETVLETVEVEPEPESEDALAVARSATRDGAVVASRYLEDQEEIEIPDLDEIEIEPLDDPTPAPTPGDSPSPTPAPSPSRTPTASPTASPGPTEEPAPTPMPTPGILEHDDDDDDESESESESE